MSTKTNETTNIKQKTIYSSGTFQSELFSLRSKDASKENVLIGQVTTKSSDSYNINFKSNLSLSCGALMQGSQDTFLSKTDVN